jgi:hypothetical protein
MGMGFPEMSREDDRAHADAVRQLDDSVEDQRRLLERRDDARETAEESDAKTDLASARARVAARDAWLAWIERGA